MVPRGPGHNFRGTTYALRSFASAFRISKGDLSALIVSIHLVNQKQLPVMFSEPRNGIRLGPLSLILDFQSLAVSSEME